MLTIAAYLLWWWKDVVASIYLLEAQGFQQPQKLPLTDQAPDSHLNGISLLSGPVQNIHKETLQD